MNELADAPTSERVRLFVALDPPLGVIDSIAAWQEANGGPGLRPVRADALHLTLAFLGERPPGDVRRLRELIDELQPGVVSGSIAPEPVPVPARRPRLLALGVQSPGAVELHAALGSALGELGFEPDRRRFWPHITVFRLGGERSGASRGGRRQRAKPFAGDGGQAFGFVRVALYRSELRSGGSSYTRLAANECRERGGRKR